MSVFWFHFIDPAYLHSILRSLTNSKYFYTFNSNLIYQYLYFVVEKYNRKVCRVLCWNHLAWFDIVVLPFCHIPNLDGMIWKYCNWWPPKPLPNWFYLNDWKTHKFHMLWPSYWICHFELWHSDVWVPEKLANW